MRVSLTYECDDPPQKAVLAFEVHDGHGAGTWTFDPPLDDDTSDPIGLLVAAMNAASKALGVPDEVE